MPSRYIIKEYVAGGVYHAYNRGVDKRDIFLDEQDYNFFIFLIKSYILPLDKQKTNSETRMQKAAFHGHIEILSYALMSNHYHLLIKQANERDLSDFMTALMTSYVSYFNKKYERTGPLFQGRYKAILVDNEDYLLHLSRYIHLNPVSTRPDLVDHDKLQGPALSGRLRQGYTSYADYLNPNREGREWVNPNIILDYFGNTNKDGLCKARSYKEFVEDLFVDESDYLGIHAID